MSFKKDRRQLGLYDSMDEHDACGLAFTPIWTTKGHMKLY